MKLFLLVMGVIYLLFGLIRIKNNNIVISMKLIKIISTIHNLITSILFSLYYYFYDTSSFSNYILLFLSTILFILLFIDLKKFDYAFNDNYNEFNTFVIFNIDKSEIKNFKTKFNKRFKLEERMYIMERSKMNRLIIRTNDEYISQGLYFIQNSKKIKISLSNTFLLFLRIIFLWYSI
ncbi:hypothetical protein [Senegalia massiliensis]|uniref:hypothetical protein n=1 Tax=Senegalia massiliensis TaxID=1720316 RepID=UPI001032411B|nr:hypothetical protein [Senegalia massiliensis]